MIQFNELKFITCNTLWIDAEIPVLPNEEDNYFEGCYIDGIKIDTQDTVCENAPSTKAKMFDTNGNEITDFPSSQQVARVQCTIDTSAFSNCATPKMLFVYVHMGGGTGRLAQAPCDWDNQYDMCAVANLAQVYQYAYKQIKCTKGCGCVGQDCAVDANFANFALQYFRLTTALDIKDWPTAYDAYLTLMRCRNKRRKTPSYKPCGCK